MANLEIVRRRKVMRDVFLFRRACVFLLASVACMLSSRLEAATINAKSVSFTDVASAITLAKEGDLVVVPAGTASWTSTLTITKGITLQGAGNNTTVILDNIPRLSAGKAAPFF